MSRADIVYCVWGIVGFVMIVAAFLLVLVAIHLSESTHWLFWWREK